MWLLLMFVWIALLSAVAAFAQQTFGLDFAQISTFFLKLPIPQQFIAGIIVFLVLWLIGSAIWQSERLARQNKSLKILHERLNGIRHATGQADESQRNLTSAVEHLIDSDPEEAISSLHKQLTDTEHKTALQQGRNEAVDMPDRLEDIRRRQKALREQLGEVAEKRRAIEPVFGELKERQGQLERSIEEIEIDDQKSNLADRLNKLNHNVTQISARLTGLEESLITLNRFKEELGKSQADLVPLQAPEKGIQALIGELHSRRDQLIKTLDQIEADGDITLGARVESLSKSKLETEQRIARIQDCFTILGTIRMGFDELNERKEDLEHLLADVETDSSGKNLTDRQNELNEFVIQTRARLRTLQDSSATLKRLNDELGKSQADLSPLQASEGGVHALIGELHSRRDQLIKTLDQIESDGDEKLGARVESLSKSKLETEQRIAQVVEHFAKLDSIRKDIGGLFTRLSITIAKLG